MQQLTERVLELAPPGGLFDAVVVRNLFTDRSEGARKLFVHRAVRAGEVLRLTPGLYLLGPPYRKSDPHPYVIAAFLHSPSHVSLQTALSHHGLIPEAVYQVGSVTLARSRTFTTPVGVFSFNHVPAALARAGVEAVKVGRDSWAFVATPLRAIADLVYLDREVTWSNDGIEYLTDSLRLEEDDLADLAWDATDEICDSIRDSRTRDYVRNLRHEVHGD